MRSISWRTRMKKIQAMVPHSLYPPATQLRGRTNPRAGLNCGYVCDVYDRLVSHKLTGRKPTPRSERLPEELGQRGRHTAEGGGAEELAVVAVEEAESRVAETHRFFKHRLEHRGEVTRRRVDDL